MMDCDLVLERGVDKGPLERGALSTISYSYLGNVHRNFKTITRHSKQTPTTPSPKHLPEIILSFRRRGGISN